MLGNFDMRGHRSANGLPESCHDTGYGSGRKTVYRKPVKAGQFIRGGAAGSDTGPAARLLLASNELLGRYHQVRSDESFEVLCGCISFYLSESFCDYFRRDNTKLYFEKTFRNI